MKSIKQITVLVCLIVFNNFVFSQQNQHNKMPDPKVNPENMAGIFRYDSDDVLKRIKIKEVTKQTIIVKAISKYNDKINEIKTFNYETFANVKTFIERKLNDASLNRDNIAMRESIMQVNEMLLPIREKVKEQQTTLNSVFEKELSPKQNHTWLKYQERKHNELQPKSPENQQMQNSGQRSQRQRQDQRMRGY